MKLQTFLVAILAFSANAHAAVVVNPTLSGPGSDTIDPTGFEAIDVTATATTGTTTPQATLEARTDLRSIQDFAGFAVGQTNIFSFEGAEDADKYDIRFSLGTNEDLTRSGEATTGGSNRALTSAGNAYGMRLSSGSSGSTSTITVSFGSYDSGSGMFTTLATGGVGAAGFTVNNVPAQLSISTIFRDAANNVLYQASFSGANNVDVSGNHRDGYFGFDTGLASGSAGAIASIEVTRTLLNNDFSFQGGTVGLDDFAFTVIPEPSSALVMGTALLPLLLSRRRRPGH